jgi:hypothetical protein
VPFDVAYATLTAPLEPPVRVTLMVTDPALCATAYDEADNARVPALAGGVGVVDGVDEVGGVVEVEPEEPGDTAPQAARTNTSKPKLHRKHLNCSLDIKFSTIACLAVTDIFRRWRASSDIFAPKQSCL